MGGLCSTSSGSSTPAKELTILVIGLDNAGKTTLTHAIKGDAEREVETVPTVGFNAPTKIQRHAKTLCFYDLGGGARIRGVWNKYFHEVHGVVYVVDAADPFRFRESRDELMATVEHPMVVGKPILVLANKQDKKEAVPDDQLIQELDLHRLTLSRHNIFPCIAQPARNNFELDPKILDGLDWISKAISSNLQNLQKRMEGDIQKFKEQEKIRKDEVARRMAKKQHDESENKSSTPQSQQQSIQCSVKSCSNEASRRCQAAGWQAVCERCAEIYESGKDAARVLSENSEEQSNDVDHAPASQNQARVGEPTLNENEQVSSCRGPQMCQNDNSVQASRQEEHREDVHSSSEQHNDEHTRLSNSEEDGRVEPVEDLTNQNWQNGEPERREAFGEQTSVSGGLKDTTEKTQDESKENMKRDNNEEDGACVEPVEELYGAVDIGETNDKDTENIQGNYSSAMFDESSHQKISSGNDTDLAENVTGKSEPVEELNVGDMERECLENEAYHEKVQADIEEHDQNGVGEADKGMAGSIVSP